VIEDRIGEVRLRIRTDLSDRADIRPAAVEMVRRALERCAAILEARAPGRVLLVRRLPLHVRADQSMLEDAIDVEDLARAAADAIERAAVPFVFDRPTPDAGGVLFQDEAQLRASHLQAVARGQPQWFHAVVDGAEGRDPLAALAAPSRRAMAYATLVHLARADLLAEALAAQPAAAVAVFAASLGLDALPERIAEMVAGDALLERTAERVADDALSTELSVIAAHWPELPAPARTLALRVHAAVLLDVEVESEAARDLAAIIAAQRHIESSRAAAADRAEPLREERHAAGATVPDAAALADVAAPETIIATCCAGLFYLLDRIQELDAAEALWKACLPEGVVLAAAMSALLGPSFAGDSTPALFGGVDAAGDPEVTPEQHADVAITVCAALAQALPRRGLAEIPPLVVDLVEHPAGRLLVAAPEHGPFAAFAWPAAAPDPIRAGLRALLDAWPHRGVLIARPALAALDSSDRLRARRDMEPCRLLIPAASSAAASALLALIAGAPSLLFAARAGSTFDSAAAFVQVHLARPGRVRLSPERMDVILGADAIDFEVRRAGLDRDPGWLPWLRRTVRFVFEERAPAAGPSRED
jgi:hypothetical protein